MTFFHVSKNLLSIAVLATFLLIGGIPNPLFQCVNANSTYVEGHIAEDTTWSLAGSPFVVVRDVVVDPNATLAIEPGVVVRFAEGCSLVVNGSLYAVGTTTKPITFTSNKATPAPGDWHHIGFTGATGSTFKIENCIVEYSTFGVWIAGSGEATVKASDFQNNSVSGVRLSGKLNVLVERNEIKTCMYGVYSGNPPGAWREDLGTPELSGAHICNNTITAANGVVLKVFSNPLRDISIINNTVKSNETAILLSCENEYFGGGGGRIRDISVSGNIIKSEGRGVFINSGGNIASVINVTVSCNTIVSNEDGVHLEVWTGYPPVTNISNNKICDNKMLSCSVGISICGGSYNWQWMQYGCLQLADVSRNVLSANKVGLLVNFVGVNATFNSISYGVCGVQIGYSSVFRRNDIYGNLCGMNVTAGSVDAENNYWGSPSGPYHSSVNPDGKGDAVIGSPNNVDLVPWLTEPVGRINERPFAVLHVDKKTAVVGETVTFDASASSDDEGVEAYFFDFGDGSNSGWVGQSTVQHAYTRTGTFNASLTVMDSLKVESANTAIVAISVTPAVRDQTPPRIVSVTYAPQSPAAGEAVTVKAEIVDEESGVAVAKTCYRVGGGEWKTASMNLKNGLWETTIDGQEAGTTVEFYVNASDGAGNVAASQVYSFTVHSATQSINIDVSITPPNPTTGDTVTFTINAESDSYILNVQLEVDGELVKTWTEGPTFVKSKTYTYTGGPYPQGKHGYRAYVIDTSGRMEDTGTRYFDVSPISTSATWPPWIPVIIATIVAIAAILTIIMWVTRKKVRKSGDRSPPKPETLLPKT